MTDNQWKRPSDVSFPSVWRSYDGKRPLEGMTPRFRIQDVTEDLEDEVIQLLTDVILRDEFMCSTAGVASDPVSLAEVQGLWREYLRYRISLVALVEPGTTPYIGHRVVGCNVLGIVSLHDTLDANQFKGEAFRKVFLTTISITLNANLFERYDVDHFLSAAGLCVSREYRGQGLGFELLKARFDMGRAVGLPLTATLFTSDNTQWMAEQLGMDMIADLSSDDLKDEEGRSLFPGNKNKRFKLMARRI
ncbi:arylalkylamine N-acetyltransferase-like 2 [Periplaneta americana]|uniref:arylalkylamine N-acetyltransferase-like 2 n=1 Tax=Periplaneta americana TaxID=6978 RepID=UPI0037E7CB86